MKEKTTSEQHEKLLWTALSLTTFFITIEITGSLISQSLALLSDAAHLLTDVLALVISIIAIRLGRKAADKKRTFGYYRLEILAAAFNASILFIVAFYIFYEAYQRLLKPHDLQTMSMLIVAVIGLIVNLAITLLLRSASQNSLNIKSAYLDAQADMLSSLGVILTALLIQITDWIYLDSVMAIGVSLWILPRAWVLLKESVTAHA
jgi:cobalt-zinc-cadmium efflux system protein